MKIPITIRSKFTIVIVATVMTFLLVIAGFFYFNYEKRIIKSEKHNELRAIANLKTSQLISWQRERISEAIFFTKNSPYDDYVKKIIDGQTEYANILRKTLVHIMTNNRYENIFLISENRELIFSVDEDFVLLDSATLNFAKKVINTGQIFTTDFYYCLTHDAIHYEVIAPVNSGDKTIAVMVFRVNPSDFLFPLIQDWPTPSKTAESLIVKREGDSVVFLNPLRHIDNRNLEFKIPIYKTEVSAVSAVLGHMGIFEGEDYRGVKVLSDISKVLDTNWYMISEVDQDEIYAEIYQRAVFIVIIVTIFILLVVVVLAWMYHYRQRNIYRELYQKKFDLHESQELFRATLYSIGDGVITTDKNGIVRQLNPVAQKLTGWKEDVAQGKKLEDVFRIINEDTREKVESPVVKVLREGSIVGLANHTLLISKKGDEIPIADSGAPIKDEKGNTIGVVLVFSDKSEERVYLKALEEREERFSKLFDRAPLGYQSLDENGNFIEVNQAWLETLGYEKEEVIGKWFGDFIAPEYIDGFKERFPIFKKQGRVHSEFEMIHKNGERRYIAFDGRIGHKLDGSFEKTHCILNDISEQKLAELALRESEARFRTIFEIASLGIAQVNPINGKIITVNNYFENITGYTASDLLSMTFVELTHPDDREKDWEIFSKAARGEIDYRNEKRYVRKDGTSVWVRLHIAFIRDDKGNPIRTVAICEDITDRKHAEQLLEANFQLLKLAGETARFGGWRVNLDEDRCTWSDEVALIHDEVPGFSPLVSEGIMYYAPEWRDKITQVFTKCAKEGIPYDEEMEIITAKGNKRWVRTNGRAERDGNGNIVRVSGSFQDITDMKQAEMELRKSKGFILAIIESLPIGIAVNTVEPSVTFDFMNDNFAKFYGVTKKEIENPDTFWEAVYDDPEFREEIKNKVLSDMASNNPERMKWIDIPIKKEGEIVRYISASNIPLAESGQVISTVWDVTERKMLELELIKLKDSLEEKVKEKTQELNERIAELERFREATIDREFRLKELRDEINRLKRG